MKTQPFEKHVWAEIDLDALRHNLPGRQSPGRRPAAVRGGQGRQRMATALCSVPAFLRRRVQHGWQ